MLIIKHTIETKASPQAIWEIWQDVAHWNTWDKGIQSSSIEGEFITGTKGVLKPKGGPSIKIELTAVKPYHLFVSESKLPLTRILVSHFVSQSNNKSFITHEIKMVGPLAFFFAYILGRKMKKNLPQDMASMRQKAENLSFIN